MSAKLDVLRDMLNRQAHHQWRQPLSDERWAELAARIQNPQLPLVTRAALRLQLFLQEERIIRS